MQQLALAQWAHDIRNALGTVALYVESLDSPADSRTTSVIACTHAMLARASAMCNDVVKQSRQGGHTGKRTGFEVFETLQHVRALVAPTLPPGASLRIAASGPARIMADPQDVFRILFNLVHNAATIARRSPALRRIALTVACSATTAIVAVSDDGPGLPKNVRSRLFRNGHSATGGTGYGLAIARELAERNGGILEFAGTATGTAFTVELPLETAERNPRPRDAALCVRQQASAAAASLHATA